YTPDLDHAGYDDNSQRDNGVRLTWQASPKQKIAVSYTNNTQCSCYFRVSTGTTSPEASVNLRFTPVHLVLSTWTYPATNRLLFEVGGSYNYSAQTVER